MFHQDILTISYKHRYELRKVFSNILGVDGIDHFSLDLVNPNSEMIFLSSTPSHGFEICSRGLAKFDGIISPKYYKNYEFYWWKNAYHHAHAEDITAIREGMMGLKHGFMLVRRWNDFIFLYSFATKSKDMNFQSYVINNINKYLRMGDDAYNQLRDTYSLYAEEYTPPVIESFFPFEGGPPPKRYTGDYAHPHNEIITKESNIITVNFNYNRRNSR